MRLFIDTNIFLEIILEQEKVEDAKALLSKIEEHDFFISDFSLHSIGLLLFYRKQQDIFQQFIKDMIVDTGIPITSLSVDDMESVVNASQKFNLDFDDAYQYVTAEKYDLIIVSFDSDFDRAERGRKTPGEILI
ncbi:MAG: PIN domain-containing protein [Thermodesulfovibrionales bacterium]|nr:PIN domain-containing protein [Thermodesulfovibrionales bacterium]